MKITLISKGKPIAEIVKLGHVLERKGHAVSHLHPNFSLNDLLEEDFWLPYLSTDVIYYRSGFGDAARIELYDKLKEKNIIMINSAILNNILLSNKIFQAILVQKAGVFLPKTLIGKNHSYYDVENYIGAPVVLKAANGIQGKEVFLINNEDEYNKILPTMKGDVLIQEFIPNDGDYRVFVVGHKVLAIFQRIPKPGDFRANISQGGSGKKVPLGPLYEKLSDIALKAIALQGLDIVGVDLIISKKNNEIYFIESNVNPGWKGLETALGISITEEIADFIVSRNN
jgi:RimK family alpha-L-glutamate ligase